MSNVTGTVPSNPHVQKWVKDVAALCQPDEVYWCDGSEDERERLTEIAIQCGDLIALNQKKLPGCYLHRSALNDVARTENLTFVCTERQEDAGPNNNWMAPAESYDKLSKIYAGSMRGRTLYVIPFLMGARCSSFSKVGIQVTDSVYVVLNMRIMTRMGKIALDHVGDSDDFTRCLHSKADLDIERRFICHYPQDNTIWSVGSGYGGNALLAKKCLALRIASKLGHKEGWLAEHMLIVGVESPEGEISYICGAFPSACGKTNLAMLVPPPSMKGWKIHTIGDDISWLRVGADGRLWAVNPEAGCFGVAPGTGSNTNRNAMRTVTRDTIFTNVALRPDGTVWWEGHDDPVPNEALDWRGKPGTPKAANRRRTLTPALQCHQTMPQLFSGVGKARRRAHQRDPFRRPPAKVDSARLSILRLAARHILRGDLGLRNDRRGHRCRGRGAARSDGDAAVLRLQHG
jgi:phosphoenolpyruvate carboxykinase (GTP)